MHTSLARVHPSWLGPHGGFYGLRKPELLSPKPLGQTRSTSMVLSSKLKELSLSGLRFQRECSVMGQSSSLS